MVRQLMKPSAFTTGDEKPVRDSGKMQLNTFAQSLEATLTKQPWWYGEAWAITDVYLWWITETAKVGGFDLSAYPGIIDFQQRIRSRPSFERALARESQAAIDIDLKLPPGAKL
jgi:glutathione S-transferase